MVRLHLRWMIGLTVVVCMICNQADAECGAPDTGQLNDCPLLDANGNLILDQCENLLVNPSAEAGDTSGWTTEPSFSTRQFNPDPFDGAYYFFAGSGSQHNLWQDVDLELAGFNLTAIDSRQLAVHMGGHQRSFAQNPLDEGQIVVEFRNEDGSMIDLYEGPLMDNILDWELIASERVLPPGTRSIRFAFTAIRHGGINNDAYLDDAYLRIAAFDLDQNGMPDICECPADFDRDGFINARDLGHLLGVWGNNDTNEPADLNHDGLVNTADFLQLLAEWGPC